MLYLIDPTDLILKGCPTYCFVKCATKCNGVVYPLYGIPGPIEV